MNIYRIKLFYADWCPHCVEFKPDWKKFKEYINNNTTLKDNENNTVKIITEEYDDKSENQMEITKENITGFPTLIMYKNNNKREIFNKRPSFDSLVKYFNLREPMKTQKGGSNLIDYYKKYIKYKQKYKSLKNIHY